jgi:predicted Zn-dependent protease
MMILKGQYYNGIQPIPIQAVLEFMEREAVLTTDQLSNHFPLDKLRVSPRVGMTDRFIDLPDGGQFQCPHNEILKSLPQISPSEGPVAWLEKRWGVALSAVAISVCILLAGYFYGLPRAAERIAARIPIEKERILGRQSLAWLDTNDLLKPTILDKTKQQEIRDGFDRLRSELPLKDYYQLEIRESKAFGANAFALPGGTIVITDDMVLEANSPDEVQAVLAHEIGHEELHHTMKSILQNSAVGVAAAAITSDAASLSVAVAGLPVLLARTKYSREFEAEADEYAFKLLKQKGSSPGAFASIMERLSEKYKRDEHAFAYVSTHPVTEERIRRARNAAISMPEGAGFGNIKSSYEAANRRNGYEAIGICTDAISSGDLSVEKKSAAFNERGNLWMIKQDYVNAITSYSEAIRLNPQFAMAFFNRGIAHFHEGQLSLAAADFEKSHQLRADTYTSIWLYLAEAKNGTDDAKMKLAKNTRSIIYDWPIPVVTLYLGNKDPTAVFVAASNVDAAIYKKQMCEASFYLGEWHMIKGEHGLARSMFSKAESECPSNNLEYDGAVSELKKLN